MARLIPLVVIATFLSLGTTSQAATLGQLLGMADEVVDDAQNPVNFGRFISFADGNPSGNSSQAGAPASNAGGFGPPQFSCCQAPLSGCAGGTGSSAGNAGGNGAGHDLNLTINITVINVNLGSSVTRPVTSPSGCF